MGTQLLGLKPRWTLCLTEMDQERIKVQHNWRTPAGCWICHSGLLLSINSKASFGFLGSWEQMQGIVCWEVSDGWSQTSWKYFLEKMSFKSCRFSFKAFLFLVKVVTLICGSQYNGMLSPEYKFNMIYLTKYWLLPSKLLWYLWHPSTALYG